MAIFSHSLRAAVIQSGLSFAEICQRGDVEPETLKRFMADTGKTSLDDADFIAAAVELCYGTKREVIKPIRYDEESGVDGREWLKTQGQSNGQLAERRTACSGFLRVRSRLRSRFQEP